MNLFPRHHSELKASGISDAIIKRYFRSIEGQEAQEWLIENAFDNLSSHSQQYATKPVQRLLDGSEHVKAGGWVCSANGQIKPDEPRTDADGKTIKYESKREKPYQGAHVSLVWPIGTPRTYNGQRLIVITEGGKKAGALATLGYEAIALAGIDMGTISGSAELIPVLAELAAEGCVFVIAYDQDSQKKKRRGVSGSLVRLAEPLVAAGCDVIVPVWSHRDGKGIDDVLVTKGADFVHSAIAAAKPFAEWKSSLPKSWFQAARPAGYSAELKRIEALHAAYIARPKADVTLNQRYLDRGQLPAPGSVELWDSPMGTGKTSSLYAGIIGAHRQKHPDAATASTSYRNILLRGQGPILNITHLLDTDDDPSLAKFGAIASCPESLPKLASQKIPAHSLVLIDEVVAWLRHIFTSDTMKNGADRVAVLNAVETLLEKVIGGGGYVVGVEADIPQWAVDCLRELLPNGTPIKLTRNEFNLKANQKAYFYDKLIGLKTEQETMVLKGGRVVAASDSAAQVDKQYRQMFNTGRDFHISADNSSDEDAQAFAGNPQAFLTAREGLRFLSYSPTIGAGVSIDDADEREPWFDAKTGVFTHLTSSDASQQLARYRRPVPMHIYCQDKGRGVGDSDLSIFCPEKLRQRWHDDAKYCHQLVSFSEYLSKDSDESLIKILERSLAGDIPEIALIDKWRSIITAVDNFDKLHLKENLQARLKEDGYEIVEVDCEKDPEKSAEYKELKEQAEAESGEEFAAVEVPETMTHEDAQGILSTHGHTRAEMLQAKKCLYQYDFPDCDLNDAQFCTEWLIKNKGKKLNQLRDEWPARNPEKAKAIDRWHLKSKLNQANNLFTGVSMADVSQRSPAADIYARAKLPEAIDAIGSAMYDGEHPEVRRVAEWVNSHQKLMTQVFRMRFNEDRSDLDLFNSLARKLGYAPKAEKVGKGRDRKSKKQYVLSDFCNPDRGHMLKSLTDKFVAKLEQKGEMIDGQKLNDAPDWGVTPAELEGRKPMPIKKAEVISEPNAKLTEEDIEWDEDDSGWMPIGKVEEVSAVEVATSSQAVNESPLNTEDDEDWQKVLATIGAAHDAALAKV